MDKIIILHSDGTKENFKPRLIPETIIKETNIDEDLAKRIQQRIAKKLYKSLGFKEFKITMRKSNN